MARAGSRPSVVRLRTVHQLFRQSDSFSEVGWAQNRKNEKAEGRRPSHASSPRETWPGRSANAHRPQGREAKANAVSWRRGRPVELLQENHRRECPIVPRSQQALALDDLPDPIGWRCARRGATKRVDTFGACDGRVGRGSRTVCATRVLLKRYRSQRCPSRT